MTFRFAEPWAFAALALMVCWMIVSAWRRSRSPAVTTSVPHRVARAGRSTRTWLLWLPPLARTAAVSLLIVALARPQNLIAHAQSDTDALALELVVDRSGSMDDPSVFEGERMNRLEAVKRVVRRFVLGDGDRLRGRTGDLLGLIVFGSYADTLMPLTTSHEALVEALERTTVATHANERSTAIGDALVLAIARLRATEAAMKEDQDDPDFTLKSKAIVLLTDGENRAGVYSPADAARLAAEWGVRVYIIGIRGGATELLPNGRRRPIGQEINEREMRAVAEHTGGKFWPVDDLARLTEVYAQVDELERTTIRVSESTEIRDLYYPYALTGAFLLLAELLLRGLIGGRNP